MRRHAQATVLSLAVLLPAFTIGVLGLAALGARVQGERAQRLADSSALRAAVGLPLPAVPGVRITVARVGMDMRATVTLPRTDLSLGAFGRPAFTARAAAVARSTTTDDGQPGAVLVG